jgi:hypothetical protein
MIILLHIKTGAVVVVACVRFYAALGQASPAIMSQAAPDLRVIGKSDLVERFADAVNQNI